MASSSHRRKRLRLDVGDDVSTETALEQPTRSASRHCYAQKPDHSNDHSCSSSPTLSPGPTETSSYDDEKEDEDYHEEECRLYRHCLYHRQLYKYHFDRYCLNCRKLQNAPDQPCLSAGDIVERLDPEELRNILVAEARQHPEVAVSLSRYFTLTRKLRKIPTFEDALAKTQFPSIIGQERRQCLDGISYVTTQVGPNSSWPTKLNAISALRRQGKSLQRRGVDVEILSGDVREAIWKILEILSNEEKAKLFKSYGPLHILMNLKIDLLRDCDPEPKSVFWISHRDSRLEKCPQDVLTTLGATSSDDIHRLKSGPLSAERLLEEAREDRDRETQRCDESCLEQPADHTNDCSFRLIYGHRPSTPEWHALEDEMEESDERSAASDDDGGGGEAGVNTEIIRQHARAWPPRDSDYSSGRKRKLYRPSS